MSTVIAVAGPPGAGKSTFVTALAERLGDACVIFCDDYEDVTMRPAAEIIQWLEDGADPDAFEIPGLAGDLSRLKAGEGIAHPVTGMEMPPARYVVFEMPFGRQHGPTAGLIDVLLWLDIPLDVALARNLREMTGMIRRETSVDGYRERLRWLDGYLDNYLGFVRDTLALQRARVGETADLKIDGCDDTARMVEAAVAGIGVHLK